MRGLSLYSGIGGLDLAAHMAGIEVAAFCEADPFCRSILARHWPEVPCYESDTLVSGDTGRIDIIFGGPPCQPHSVAGKKQGVDDPRHRWPEMARIVSEFRPAWVVVENVAGFGDVAERFVRPDLESLGYEAIRFDIPAASVGAPHKRERVFIVAYAGSNGCGECGECGEAYNDYRSVAPGNESGRCSACGAVAYARRGDLQRRAVGGSLRDEEGSREGEGLQRERRRDSSGDGSTVGVGQADPNHPRWRERRGTEPVRAEQSPSERGRDAVGDAAQRGRGIVRPETEPDGSGPEPQRAGGAMELTTASGSQEGQRGAETTVGRPTGRDQRRDGAEGSAESRLGGDADGFPSRMDSPRWPAPRGCDQYEWEPPRTTTERENRRKRLKALGNAVVPAQAYPIFAAIAASE